MESIHSGKGFPPYADPLLLRQAQDGEPVEPLGGEKEIKEGDYHRVHEGKS